MSSSACVVDSVTMTPLPAARPSALSTAQRAVRGELRDERGCLRVLPAAERPRPGHAHAGSLRHLVAERLGRLHPGGSLRRARTPAIPAAASASDTPAPSGASGPTTTRSTASACASPTTAGGSSGLTGVAADARLLADPRAAGRHEHLPDARLVRELPGERVLAAAPTEDEDAGRDGEGHAASFDRQAGRVGRCRIGRQARSMVWVRSGPTETNTIGTPAWSSSAVT